MAEERLYTLGGKVQASGGVYLERRADADLAKLCREHALSYVLYTRQVGKSSLLAHVAQGLEAEGACIVIIDLTMIGTEVTAEQWYLGLLVEIADQAGLADDILEWWEGRAHLGFTQRVRVFFIDLLLPQVDRDVFVFLDEVDTTVPLPFTDDFFAAIRELYQARDREPALRRLTFVLAGSSSPNDLIRDPDRTPFNIGVRVELGDFSHAEAAPLAAGLSADPAEGRQLLEWILEWTGGHPYLTQVVCADVAKAAPRVQTAADVEAIVATRFFQAQGDEDKNLAYVTDMLTARAERFGEGEVLRVYRRILTGRRMRDDTQSLVLSHLKLSGIVVAVDGWLLVRNRIYARVFDRAWVDRHLPVNWRAVARTAWTAMLVISLPFAIIAIVQSRRTTQALEELRLEERARIAALAEAEAARERAEEERRKTEIALDEARTEREIAELAFDAAVEAQKDSERAGAEKAAALEKLGAKVGELEQERRNLEKTTQALKKSLIECVGLDTLKQRVNTLEGDLRACRGNQKPH